jgi:hypothetical protein
MGKLTNKAAESLARAAVPGKTNEGDSLYLQISKSGVASRIFRYKVDGRSREMELGPFPTAPSALLAS